MQFRQVLPLLAIAVLATASCSSGDDTDGGGGTGGTTATGTTTTGTGATGGGGNSGGSMPTCNQSIGDGGSTCTGTGGYGGGVQEAVNSVTADISDLSGAPAANIVADVCGSNRCENATADASGHVEVNAGGQMFDEVRLLYGDGFGWVKFAAPLPSVPDAAFGPINAVRLPALATGAAWVPGQAVVSGDVTLTLDANVFVQFNTLYYCDAADQGFRAATIPLDGSATLPAIDPALNLEQAYGLAPIDTKLCPPAQMTVPNTSGWAANLPVEFWYQGTTIFQEFAPYGGWEKVSDGTVSGDGATISTSPGGGIPQLGVIAIRLTP